MSILKPSIITAILALTMFMPVAYAQDVSSLKRENARLRAELVSLKKECGSGGDTGSVDSQAGEQRIGDLAFSVVSIRVGNQGHYRNVNATLRIRNLGSKPVALNYIRRSLSLVDDLGYRYDEGKVIGISTADNSGASTNDVVMPGNTLPVTFEVRRYAKNDAETIGERFDINATFGQFEDLGQGRLKSVRNYSVAFVSVPRRK